MGPTVDGLEKKYEGNAVFAKFYVNTASHLEYIRAQKVRRIPTFRFINSKTEIITEMTGTDKAQIEANIQKIL